MAFERSKVRGAELLLVAAALLALAGCGTHGIPGTHAAGRLPAATATPSAPPDSADREFLAALGRARLAERHERGAADRVRALEARARLDAAHDEAQAALLAGDEEAALSGFDRALENVLSADVDLEKDVALRGRVEEILAEVHATAADLAAQRTDGGLDAAPAHWTLAEEGLTAALGRPAPQVTGDASPAGVPELDPNPGLPGADHPAIDSMVAFYTGRAKDRFELGLRRYGQYAPTVRRILAEEGVPADIAWLALVESNYNPKATSRARAHGLWQFIPGTGRKYGLAQDFWVDERADFEKATRSAARYLKDLHGMFGDWHLAIAAYNAGEGKIGRGLRATGAKDFWALRKTRYIRVETKNYVPALLAVMRIVRAPEAHGITFAPLPALEWERATVSAATALSVLAACAGTTPEHVAALNPELRRGVTPGTGGAYELRVPPGSRETFLARHAALPPEARLTWTRHVVRRGDTLGEIAAANGSTVAAVMAANRLTSANRIAVGWTLVVPTGATAHASDQGALAGIASGTRPGTESAESDATRAATRVTRKVRPGDTLSSIARRHGTTVARLAALNGLANASRIRVGQRLVINPGAGHEDGAPSGARRTHVVKRGDTLTKIARAYRTTVANLVAWNAISHQSTIRPGDRLTIRAR